MKRETNEQLVRRLMNFGPYGALSQVFIMQAIDAYAKAVVRAGPEKADTPFISGRAWVGTAAYLLDEMAKHYGTEA